MSGLIYFIPLIASILLGFASLIWFVRSESSEEKALILFLFLVVNTIGLLSLLLLLWTLIQAAK